MRRRRASSGSEQAGYRRGFSLYLFPELDDLELRQHANRTRPGLVLGRDQAESPLCAKQGLPVGSVGKQYFIVNKGWIELGEREHDLVTILRLGQDVAGERFPS